MPCPRLGLGKLMRKRAGGTRSPARVSLCLLRRSRLAALGLAGLGALLVGEALALAVVLTLAVVGRALAITLALAIVRPFAVDALRRLGLAGEGDGGRHQCGERSGDRHALQCAVLHLRTSCCAAPGTAADAHAGADILLFVDGGQTSPVHPLRQKRLSGFADLLKRLLQRGKQNAR